MKEQTAKCRHSNSRLIAAIAAIDFDDGEWPELLPALFSLASNQDRVHREVGSYIIYSSLEANPLIYESHVHKLLELFSHTIKDPQSADVRVNTMLSIGAMLMIVDSDNDTKAVSAIQDLIVPIGAVLKDAIDAGDDEKVKPAFEVLQQFLAYESSFLGPHLKNLLLFMLEAGANTAADEDIRLQALAFLVQAVQYRRMKIQAMGDVVTQMVFKGLQILTELDEDDEPDEASPARAALGLLDELASDLPARLVMVPLLEQFPKLSASSDPSHRKAGILALGACAEGAPDFVMTQLKPILPVLIQLLNDSDGEVRHCALVGLTGLAEEMAEDLAVEHEAIISAISKNLQASMVDAPDEKTAKKNASVIRSACAALDAMSEGIKSEIMAKYSQQLIGPIGRLLSHPDPKIKMASAGALGAIAGSLGEEFKPYFEQTMSALGAYLGIKDSDDDLLVRGSVCDAMGRIAVAVGPLLFQPYVVELMKASEENLHLENERLRESSFILWASLAKVYGKDFKPFLSGVFKGLFEALELEEEEIILDLTEEEKEIVGDSQELVTGGKRVKVRQTDTPEEGILMDDDDDEDDEDWEDFVGSAEAMEKEVAIEILGDVISHACGQEEVAQYLEKAVEISKNLIDHPYEGIRKAAVSTLWRSYARVWQLMEEETGAKWQPGFPPNNKPTPLLVKLGEMVAKPTLPLWLEESDR
jgi:importin-4